jgi:feruloyl esterase
MALTPFGTIRYYESVVARDPAAAEDVRLIMLPGVDHCVGGPGPSLVDWLDEVDRWVTSGTAPESVTAAWFDEQMRPVGSRIACAYPKVVRYDGVGDPRDAASFSCSESE